MLSFSFAFLATALLYAYFVPLMTSTPFIHNRQIPNTTLSVDLIHQYTPPTWVENIAVRPNGWLLPTITLGTSAVLNQLSPATGELLLVHDFSDAGNAIQGITEVAPDFFALDVLTCNLTALSCTQGSASTWTVDFRTEGQHHQYGGQEGGDATAAVRRIANFTSAGFLNGMAALNEHTVLLADSFLGGVWCLDVYTGSSELIFTDNSMKGPTAGSTGLNGIRVRPGVLYFTNSALGTFNRIAIDPSTAQKTGNATLIASGLIGPDDFEIDDGQNAAYLCNGVASQLLRIGLDGVNETEVVANIAGPTSARRGPSAVHRGQGEHTLYVTEIGGLLQYAEHNITVGGAIDRLEIA